MFYFKWESLNIRCIAVTLLIAGFVTTALEDKTYAEMRTYRNIDYVPTKTYADNRDKLDIFMPKQSSDVPIVIYFHGGALQRGDKSQAEGLAAQLTERGIGVVSANYRLSPQVMHPAHVEDAAEAVAWAYRNIKAFGGDRNRLYLSGHSAGAYLATLLSLNASYLEKHRVALFNIRGTVAISPFLYVEDVAPDRPKTVWGTDQNVWVQASVSPYVGNQKPPILFIYADGDDDWRKQQNERLAKELRNAGNPGTTTSEIADRNHGTIISAMRNNSDPGMLQVAAFVTDSN